MNDKVKVFTMVPEMGTKQGLGYRDASVCDPCGEMTKSIH